MMMLLLAAASCAAVEGEMIRLADFVRALPAFAAAPAETPVAFAPSFGAQRTFAASDVQRLAARYGVEVPATTAVCFSRPTHKLDEAGIKGVLLKALSDSGAHLELVDFARYDVPQGEVDFNRTGLQRAAPGDGTRLWRGRVVYGNHRSFPVWAKVRLSLQRECLVAAGALPAGKPLADGDVRVETREVDPLEPCPAVRAEEVTGKLVRRGIAAGSIILPSSVTAAPLVTRGQEVEVTVHSGSAQLKLVGKAQKAGKEGDVIAVRNPSSGRSFSARVAGKGQVVVGVSHENRN